MDPMENHEMYFGADMQTIGMFDDPVQLSDSEHVVPCVGQIGDIRSILAVEVNGMKTTMLFAKCFSVRNGMKTPVYFASSIPEDQIKRILPNYLNVLRPSQEDLYWNISGQNIGEVDLDLKVGHENITARFCVVRNASVKKPLINPSGHLLMGGNGLISQLGMRFRLGERQVLIKKSEGILSSSTHAPCFDGKGSGVTQTSEQYSIPYAGPIGDNGPILIVEINGINTTMLFLANSKSSCIPEEQLKDILPEYKDMLRPSQKMLYISGKNIGEVDLELKVGQEQILASFCAVRENVDAPLKFPSGGTYGHLLIAGSEILTKLGMDMGPGEREMTITRKISRMLLPMDEVREAIIKRSFIEMDVGGKDKTYGIMKFQMEDEKYQVEIHCSTGALLIILDHSSGGRKQINRSVRTVDRLISVLEDPNSDSCDEKRKEKRKKSMMKAILLEKELARKKQELEETKRIKNLEHKRKAKEEREREISRKREEEKLLQEKIRSENEREIKTTFQNICKEGLSIQLRYPTRPDAICRLDKCLQMQNIYTSDPDYKGHFKVFCRMNCQVSYHKACWMTVKGENNKKMKMVKVPTEKDFLGQECFTPDCNGVIVKIEIFDENMIERSIEDIKLNKKLEDEEKIMKEEARIKKENERSMKIFERKQIKKNKQNQSKEEPEENKPSQLNPNIQYKPDPSKQLEAIEAAMEKDTIIPPSPLEKAPNEDNILGGIILEARPQRPAVPNSITTVIAVADFIPASKVVNSTQISHSRVPQVVKRPLPPLGYKGNLPPFPGNSQARFSVSVPPVLPKICSRSSITSQDSFPSRSTFLPTSFSEQRSRVPQLKVTQSRVNVHNHKKASQVGSSANYPVTEATSNFASTGASDSFLTSSRPTSTGAISKTDQPGAKTGEQYDRLVAQLQKNHPSLSQEQARTYVMEVRQSNNGKLTGMKRNDILNKVASFIQRDKAIGYVAKAVSFKPPPPYTTLSVLPGGQVSGPDISSGTGSFSPDSGSPARSLVPCSEVAMSESIGTNPTDASNAGSSGTSYLTSAGATSVDHDMDGAIGAPASCGKKYDKLSGLQLIGLKLTGMSIQHILNRAATCIDEGNEDSECCICLEGMSIGDSVYLKPCRHRFHKVCINQWLESPGGVGSTCPMCRNYIVKEDEFPDLGTVRKF